jgi:hypothetical protein
MKRFWFLRAAKFAIIMVVALGVLSLAAMYLWNWLVPTLFAGPTITYLQTLGLLVLSRLLLGGLRPRGPFGHGHHGHWHRGPWQRGHWHRGRGPFGHRMHGMQWSRMTREERQDMRQKMREELREHLRGGRGGRRGFGSPPPREPDGPESEV